LVAKMEAGLMDAAPVWTDLKTFPWESFRDRVDILTGGYPCQPFSAAGKRAGKDDPRHLWPWIADGVAAMRPRVCFFENVEGHITLGLREVIAELESLGYKTTFGIFSAAECGAPHQRKRVFIMAHNKDERRWGAKRWSKSDKSDRTEVWDQPGEQGRVSRKELAHCVSKRGQLSGWRRFASQQVFISNGTAWRDVWPSRPRQPQHAWEPPRVVANAESQTSRGLFIGEESQEPKSGFDGKTILGNADRAGSQERSRERGTAIQRINADGGTDAERQTQPTLGGDADGVASRLDYAELCVTCDNRTDELRLLGNGVVPATAALAFTTLLNEQRNPRHLA
jgi:DNA (cytosine-5)-methyltransferase 1